jgi:hypothetical protein
MLIFHSLPRAARRTLTRQLIGEMRRRNRFQYYEPMHLFTPQPKDQPCRILFDESERELFRVDPITCAISSCASACSARENSQAARRFFVQGAAQSP